MNASTSGQTPPISIAPCRDAERLRRYIDQHWKPGHILARSPVMFDFQYRTPWAEAMFGDAYSILEAERDGELVGFIGAIAAPYPADRSLWLALWHVIEKGTGVGGRLLAEMEQRADWIGTFGAGPEALPIYRKRGYHVTEVRRWVHRIDVEPRRGVTGPAYPSDWVDYRFRLHPVFDYEFEDDSIMRYESNEFGEIAHAITGYNDRWNNFGFSLVDCWSPHQPSGRWRLAPQDMPSVFHPPEARGNTIYAVGKPTMPVHIGKGDCDQDRPV